LPRSPTVYGIGAEEGEEFGSLIRSELDLRRRLTRLHCRSIAALTEPLAGGAGGTSCRGSAMRIAIGGRIIPSPGGDPERLTTGGATPTPASIKAGADLFEELRNRKFKAANARRSEHDGYLPLCKLISGMHNAAEVLAGSGRNERCLISVEI
jgi:hypothetical protein